MAPTDRNTQSHTITLAIDSDVALLTVGSIPELTAKAIYPSDDEIGKRRVAEIAHKNALWKAIRAGEIEARNSISLEVVKPPADSSSTWGYDIVHEAYRADLMVSAEDFYRFAKSLSITVRFGGAKEKETPAQRKERLGRRANELKSGCVKDWLKRLAAEEGLSNSRIKQILTTKKAFPAKSGSFADQVKAASKKK